MSSSKEPPSDDLLKTVPPTPVARGRGGQALPQGTRLAEFEIRDVIGEGGFGIVYLAWDQSLQRQVAIKEYMPSSLASRTGTERVAPRSDKAAETFMLGLRSFINEGQLLASFDHPALLKVYRFWEGNGTAYMVMPYYQGITLKRALAGLDAPPEQGWLERQLAPLLDALELMHEAHCYHRDVAADNILLLDDGTPLLLDFGAARRVIGDATQALTAFLKPGYAPVEQYGEMPDMKQGPWTDLYALASVVHFAVTGHTPPESVARLVRDTRQPLERVAAGRYGQRFLRAIDHALAVRPHDRPQCVAAMRAELGFEPPRQHARQAGEIPTAPIPFDDESTLAPDDDATIPPTARREAAASARSAPATLQRWQRARLRWVIGSGVFAAAALSALWWSLSGEGSASPTATLPTAAAPAPTATPAPGVAAEARDTTTPLVDMTPRAATTSVDVTETRDATEPPRDAARSAGGPADSVAAQPQPAAPADAASGAVETVANKPAPDRRSAGAAQTARTTPRSKLSDPRCAEIITRVSLGENLSPDERALLQKECRK